ncbi:MAG: hypothetical protein CMO81_04640 [Waddliaceae bacterium]|nr:hypothetical protein [Waddliaceae bacterium]
MMDSLSLAVPARAQVQQASFYSSDALSGMSRKDPKKVATQFEAIFYRMILKQMRDSSLSEGLFDSSAMQQTQSMQDDELANLLAGHGALGIKDLVMSQVQNSTEQFGLLKPEPKR